jgi:hypothetical protein
LQSQQQGITAVMIPAIIQGAAGESAAASSATCRTLQGSASQNDIGPAKSLLIILQFLLYFCGPLLLLLL